MSLGSLFGKKRLRSPLDLSAIATDMHSHLVPGIDDGVSSLEDSLSSIRKMGELGYKRLITTPHVQQERFANTPEKILAGLAEVKKAAKEEGLEMELEAAAEYLIDQGFLRKMEEGRLLTFGDNYLLVELSYYSPHPDLNDIIFQLQVAGYKVILAHPERYSYWFNSWDVYTRLKDRSVFFQCNLLSLAGAYPEPVKKMAKRLIREGMVEFAGSDLHGERHFKVLEQARYEKALDELIRSGRLLNPGL